VLAELRDACREYGLRMGVYLSPWDRNHQAYGTEAYNQVYVEMMEEIVARYGPFFEFWWDGANGEGPNGKKQVYDFSLFEKTMRRIGPGTVVFSDIGPDIRWVGNERGIAGKTNWNLLDTAGFFRGAGAPPTDTLNRGNENGHNWIPAECDVSIRPGWFYHEQEDGKVKSPAELFQLYLRSVGRGSALLLNVPPDQRGLIHGEDSAALMGFKRLREENLGKALEAKGLIITQSFRLELTSDQTVNCIMIKEILDKGQHCKRFSIRLQNEKQETINEILGTTIGRERILSFDAVRGVRFIVLSIEEQKALTLISEINAYHIAEGLVEKD
jgi:alpha-L-fucosidase